MKENDIVNCRACSGEGCSDAARAFDQEFRCDGYGGVTKEFAEKQRIEFERRNKNGR